MRNFFFLAVAVFASNSFASSPAEKYFACARLLMKPWNLLVRENPSGDADAPKTQKASGTRMSEARSADMVAFFSLKTSPKGLYVVLPDTILFYSASRIKKKCHVEQITAVQYQIASVAKSRIAIMRKDDVLRALVVPEIPPEVQKELGREPTPICVLQPNHRVDEQTLGVVRSQVQQQLSERLKTLGPIFKERTKVGQQDPFNESVVQKQTQALDSLREIHARCGPLDSEFETQLHDFEKSISTEIAPQKDRIQRATGHGISI